MHLAKERARAREAEAREDIRAIRVVGRVSRQVEERVVGRVNRQVEERAVGRVNREVAREGAFMGIKVAREERVVLIVGKRVIFQLTAPFPKCATIVGAHTT